MRLLECHIDHFGKFANYRKSFRPGMNTVLAENGYGKTTLSLFIKVMLYGMADTRKARLEENERKRLLPWEGGKCGGSLTLEAGGKRYRVERTFGARASEDTFALYDAESGRPSGDYTADIGEELFGIDADGFERTVFLSERNLRGKCENKSVSAKLADLSGTDGDVGDLDRALDLLEERRKFYSKRGGTGELDALRRKLSETEREIADAQRTAGRLEEEERGIAEIKKHIDELSEHARQIERRRTEAARAQEKNAREQEYARMLRETEDLRARMRELDTFFAAGVPTPATVSDMRERESSAARLAQEAAHAGSEEYTQLCGYFAGGISPEQMEDIRRTAARAREARETLVACESERQADETGEKSVHGIPPVEEIDRLMDALGSVRTRRRSAAIPLLCAAAVFLLAGVVLGRLLFPVLYLLLLPAVLLAAGAEYLGWRARKGDPRRQALTQAREVLGERAPARQSEVLHALIALRREAEGLQAAARKAEERRQRQKTAEATLAEAERTIDSFLSRFPTGGRTREEALAEVEAKFQRYYILSLGEEQIATAAQQKARQAAFLQRQVREFLAQYPTRTDTPLPEIERALYERASLEKQISGKEAALTEYRDRYGVTGTPVVPDAPDEGEWARVQEETTAQRQKLTLAERQYNDDCTALELLEELREKKRETEEKIAQYSENLQTVVTARQMLAEAGERLVARYIGPARKHLEEYLSEFGQTEVGVQMDATFDLALTEGGQTRHTDSYSRGTQELYALAVRLALVDSLYEGETPFLIFDDPFAYLDDTRSARAIAALQKIAARRQILYLTCSSARAPR